jgi:chorismate mutase/prephenate dehydratase
MPRSAAPAVPIALSAADKETPPAQDGWRGADLGLLRAELDRIDDAMHGLLMDRAKVVEQVARAGKPAAFRPGREAAIIRRLLERHEGHLPPQTIVRMWRELLAGTTAMQGVFSVAVCEPDGGTEFLQLSREHFGTLTPVRVHPSADQALTEVRQGAAAVAVLPFPREGGNGWWTGLLDDTARCLHVVARLPFWSIRTEGAPVAQALVVAATSPDPSGSDRSLLGLQSSSAMTQAGLASALREAGFHAGPPVIHPRGNGALALAEVEGFVTDDDPRLGHSGWIVLGAYAVPVGGERP